MKGKNAKKPASSKVHDAVVNEPQSTVTPNKKHHKKPKKQYL